MSNSVARSIRCAQTVVSNQPFGRRLGAGLRLVSGGAQGGSQEDELGWPDKLHGVQSAFPKHTFAAGAPE